MKRIKTSAPYIVILFIMFGTHGLLLFNDGIYWDDWLWITALKEKNWATIYAIGFERGVPLDTYFQWFFSTFHNIEFAHRLIAFLSILFTSVLVYVICCQVGVLTHNESLFVALIGIVYPAFQTQVLLSTTNYLFYYMLFLAGVFLALRSENIVSFGKYTLRLGALILFFLSFSLASLLVFYFGFLLLLALFVRESRVLSVKAMLTHFLPRHLDYILLPLFYWNIKAIFFPVYGLYANYNQIAFSVKPALTNLVIFLNNGIFQHFYAPLKVFFSQREVALLVSVSFLWMLKYSGNAFLINSKKSFALIVYALILLSLGMLPYIAVGRGPALTGWDTRHGLLLALPVALLIVVIVRILFSTSKTELSRSGWILLIVLLLAFGFANVLNYIDVQARWVKDRSIMVNLARMEGSENYSIYWIEDRYPLGGEAVYSFYEWSSMFEQVWGDETRIGLDLNAYYTAAMLTDGTFKPSFTNRYNLSGFDPTGCQATLKIWKATSIRSKTKLVARYFYFKFLRPQDMQHFLKGITALKIQALPSPSAVGCSK